MSRLDPTSTRLPIAHQGGRAAGAPLIQVSWNASPDLGEFLGFIRAYAKGRFSGSMAERLTLTSNELLDNALRYGSLAREFSYRLELDSAKLTVCVQNRTVPTRIDMLASQLRRLELAPAQVYASELERTSASGGRRSMLGLARIRHEAEMELELQLDDLDVTVRAYCPR
jgi:hypothetical protein